MLKTKNTGMIAAANARTQKGESLGDTTEVAADMVESGNGFNWKHALIGGALLTGGSIVAGVCVHAAKEYALPKRTPTAADFLGMNEAQWLNLLELVPCVNAGIETETKTKTNPEA